MHEPLSILVVLAYIMTKDVFLIQYFVGTPKFESETLLLILLGRTIDSRINATEILMNMWHGFNAYSFSGSFEFSKFFFTRQLLLGLFRIN